MRKLIAIDFGSTNTLIYSKDKGIIFHEPSVVALDINSRKVLTVGVEAQRMIGKTPTNIKVINPLKYGSVDKFEIAIKMLKMMIENTKEGNRFNRTFSRAQVLVGVPSNITQVETRGIEEVVLESGAKKVILIKEVIADAVSTGIDIFEPDISFIVNVGGGTTDVAAISLGGILAEESIKVGGYDIDHDIILYIKKHYNVEIGDLTAEILKNELADVLISDKDSNEVVGQDLASGLPVYISISNEEIYEAINISVEKIIVAVKKVIEKCPPESSNDILKNGIVLTGGVSKLKNLDELIQQELSIKAHTVEEPEYATINGLGLMLDDIDLINNMVLEYRPRRKIKKIDDIEKAE